MAITRAGSSTLSDSAFCSSDMNGDGTPDYGSCISKKRNAQAYWMIHSIVGGFIQTKGTGQGVFFDTKTMKPLVNNAANYLLEIKGRIICY